MTLYYRQNENVLKHREALLKLVKYNSMQSRFTVDHMGSHCKGGGEEETARAKDRRLSKDVDLKLRGENI